ncbi:hypothetical protein GCM10007967_32330 [Xylanimonas ulmi]|uniref:Uncharacterized protein n=1 Tax=Xylanimonas ulmi TaxID=228973 RepID=A0A4Q7LZM7_9MICO|nr:hypothetical protein EV386_0712 [Xylanibacterium ulmi]
MARTTKREPTPRRIWPTGWDDVVTLEPQAEPEKKEAQGA